MKKITSLVLGAGISAALLLSQFIPVSFSSYSLEQIAAIESYYDLRLGPDNEIGFSFDSRAAGIKFYLDNTLDYKEGALESTLPLTLERGYADCGSYAIAAAALMHEKGYPPLILHLHNQEYDHWVYIYNVSGKWGSIGGMAWDNKPPEYDTIEGLAASIQPEITKFTEYGVLRVPDSVIETDKKKSVAYVLNSSMAPFPIP